MLEDLISAFVRSQFGDVKRRTTGAVLEVGALGLVGLATVFLSIGLFLWLSARMETWLAAMAVGVLALLVALVVMLVGRSLLRRQAHRESHEMLSGLDALSVLARRPQSDRKADEGTGEPEAAIVGVALVVGVLLGRFFKR
jgi:hypothetical protein